MVKTPKIHFLDSGLLATTRGLTFDRVKADRTTFGPLLESFVFSEILKLMTSTDPGRVKTLAGFSIFELM